jgi:two-component system, NtrC family, response regulator
MQTILIVDDEKNYLLVLEDLLSDEGYQVLTADNAQRALVIFRSHDLDLVITDMKMPGMDGMALLEQIHADNPDLPVVMMTAFGSVEKAVEGMKKGAFDYIEKPFKNEQLKLTIRKAIDHYRLICRNRELSLQLQDRYQFDNIIGKSASMQRIYQLIEKVAPSRATVLITGESGTGKELIARSIHFNSPRRELPFISVNCGALPETLLESELFGHEKGAFSGAVSQRKGRFELAHEGTLFLDEVSEMSPHLQVKLLRILQEMEFERVGGATTIKVDVRVVAASNRDLKEEVALGRFRADLFYRLNVVHIHLPPLRARSDDIPLLVNHFLNKYCRESQASPLALDPEALRTLLDYPWPGNVRELENVIERSVILSTNERISERDLPLEIREVRAPATSAEVPSQELRRPEATGAAGVVRIDPGEKLPQWGTNQRQLRALGFIKSNGFITNKYYSKMNDISERQALRELTELVEKGALTRIGKGRACRYVSADDVGRL